MFITLTLAALGIAMVFDGSLAAHYVSSPDGTKLWSIISRHVESVVAGTAVMFLLSRYQCQRLRNLAPPVMIGALVLLMAVWVPHIGRVENNAARWIKLGPLQAQPSEFAKLAIVLYLSALLSRSSRNIRAFTESVLPALLVTGLTLALIEREPDLGTAFVLFMEFITILYIAGARRHHIIAVCVGTALVVLAFGFVFGHRQGRITAFLHPDRDPSGLGYQVFHSRLAVGSGRMIGLGLGFGREKYYLPQADSDFVVSTFAEETGFVGCSVLIGLYAAYCFTAIEIAHLTRDRFSRLLAWGTASMVAWQSLVNLSVATGAIPATGVPLPFVSFGSSSLVMCLAASGILMSISRSRS
jgi:cell division protein FtsW